MVKTGRNLLLVLELALVAELASAVLRELVAVVLGLGRVFALGGVLLLVSRGLLQGGSLLRAGREKGKLDQIKSAHR